ncbi:hypothetical protein SAMN02745121_00229 [Nannocystis exedens]|uniref:Leucine-rich repeat domain-containing protein n=1 Tax=Nannocystis exedens TaxID=54 RepID=A0A1I1SS65_9BACT|nr:hypothetical protein [Nannocystis exedens]PCC75689.1 hypothetical protein NAEX_08801 [Nannocystis exedens]SFD49256.1 hypothetical protein SAMN02745121_00229 [Nannocystis exedens]
MPKKPSTAARAKATKATRTTAAKPATKKTAVKKATKTTAKKTAAKKATKTTAKQTAPEKATKKTATKRPKIDPLRELAWDVHGAFDAEDPTPAVQIDFVDGYLATAADRGIDVDLDAALPYCAEVLDLELGELRATYEAHARQLAAARGASGQAGEVDALIALCRGEGRHGQSFKDDAARALPPAWPRLGPELGRCLFAGRKHLWLRNAGPFATLAGFEAARDARSLELQVTPDCDLTPLASLTRLESLRLDGKLEGFGALARLPRLKSLQTEANAAGIAELASLPVLRVLSLIVAADVSIAGLVDLEQLNLLELQAGSRPLDDVTAATIATLARKKSRLLRLAEHEGWPLQLALPYRRTPGYVDINRR